MIKRERNMKVGHLSIFSLFEFVAEHPDIPRPLKKSERWRGTPYRQKVVSMLECSRVPKEGGWYLWGRFNEAGWWDTLYVGKTDSGKTSNLFVRLRDELQEESVAIFATVYGTYRTMEGTEKVLKQFAKEGGKDWFKPKSILRNMRKTGAHFIIWVADGTANKKRISEIESALIEIYRPGFNLKRPLRGKPMSLKTAVDAASNVYDLIEREISIMLDGTQGVHSN